MKLAFTSDFSIYRIKRNAFQSVKNKGQFNEFNWVYIVRYTYIIHKKGIIINVRLYFITIYFSTAGLVVLPFNFFVLSVWMY